MYSTMMLVLKVFVETDPILALRARVLPTALQTDKRNHEQITIGVLSFRTPSLIISQWKM